MPKVSILLPFYNAEEFLEIALQSVLVQTLLDIEIICLDDGSTDRSLAIANRFAQQDSRVKISSESNQGYGATLNRGLKIATADYIGIVESDDWIGPEMYEILYSEVRSHQLDSVKCNYQLFGDGEERDHQILNQSKKYHQVLDLSQNYNSLSESTAIWCGIYRKSWLADRSIRFNCSPGANYQDTSFFFLTTVLCEKAYFVNKSLYHYRIDNPKASRKYSADAFAINKEYDFLRNYLMDNYSLWESYQKFYNFRKFLSYFWMVERIDPEEIPAFVDQMSKEFSWAQANQGLDSSYFNEPQWKTIEWIIRDPHEYFLMNFPDPDSKLAYQEFLNARKKVEELEHEIFEIKQSTTWKVGRYLTWLPRVIKQKLHQ